ncbi:tRNA lysidine(34) synthetase TilS [uncultured Paraglaciecola sp.]|uniref:tRNA lysidine(34) synthetase TilS n=1 Tax=uncultured Paraglaciecola sp. TaxID=1765024 RepID=UPI0026301537|nr:tRNA lysidine(34) synthetase TilS [uncultured Paraglaciecola sp.]
MSLLSELQQHLSKSPLKDAADIVVAYSGGVDSHVLLHALHHLKQSQNFDFQIHAIHIHHGLSQHADKWQDHCRQVCATLGVSFQTAKVVVQAAPRQSLEAQARAARYQNLVALAPADSQVLLGQHQDDQLETFLLQLKRGAGPKGLSAMNRTWLVTSPLQANQQVGFYRPLLDVSQQAILDYAHQHELKWCEDESNQDTDFERNFLRHKVLPTLQQRWPEISQAVARSAALCAEQQSLLDASSAEKLQLIKASENSLQIAALKQLSQPWLHQLVRYWLSELNIQSPSLTVLNKLSPEVLNAAQDATPILQWNGWQFRRFDQQLFVIKTPPEKVIFNTIWQQQKSITLPNNMGYLVFSSDGNIDKKTQLTIKPNLGPIAVKMGGYSLRFTPQGSDHSKPIKQWFKQWKIAPWIRETALLILQNDQVLGVYVNGYWHVAQPLEPITNHEEVWHITVSDGA